MASPAPVNPNTRIVITMSVGMFEFTMQLIERAAAQGLVHPSEMVMAGRAWEAMSSAQAIQVPEPPKPEDSPSTSPEA